MSVVFNDVNSSVLPGGQKLLYGTLNIGTYATSGVNINLSNYLYHSTYPIVWIGSANGYTFQHNFGTARGGLVKAYMQHINAKNGIDQNIPMGEVPNSTDMAAVLCSFMAVGQAY